MKLYTILILSTMLLATVPVSEAATETQTRIREYSVFTDDGRLHGTTSFQFNATPFDLTGIVIPSQSSTYLHFWATAQCKPSGITSCNVAFSVTANNGTGQFGIPSGSPQMTQGAGQAHITQSWSEVWDIARTDGSDHYFTDTAWINVTVQDVNNNADLERYGFQVWQREVYTLQVSTGGGSVELNDHNVTVIEGDPNRAEMRTYIWVIGFALFFLLLAEWKRDMMHYIFAIITLAYATIDFPSFLPATLRIFPVALALYSGGLMMKEYRITRQAKEE